VQLKSPDGDFVVKQFFRLKDNEDEPDDPISIADNNMQIEAELGRLVVGQWFLSAFFKHARSCGVTVDESSFFFHLMQSDSQILLHRDHVCGGIPRSRGM
jgi:hypothetical protein